jgi:hypothetical protein
MRKLVLLACTIAVLGLASASFAALNLTFDITVTVRANNIDIITNGASNKLSWGVIANNSSVVGSTPNTWTAVTPVYQVINNGSGAIKLQVYMTSLPSGWTKGANGAPGTGYPLTSGTLTCRLYTVFTGYLTQSVLADFGATDEILLGAGNIKTAANATGTFQRPGEGADGYTGGENVVPETYGGPDQYKGTRVMQFCLDTPYPAADQVSVNLGIYLTAISN